MRAFKHCIAALGAISLFLPASAWAEVKKLDDNGFLVGHIAEVEAKPEELWKRLVKPADWWTKAHSWSGSVEGFTLNPVAGGCFCEQLREDGKTRGSVEHMRVIYADPGKVLRLQGALGPLQSEAVTGTLTIAMEPVKGKAGVTRISFNYIVGGYMRFASKVMAPAVDNVIGEQFKSLLAPFGSAEKSEAKSAEQSEVAASSAEGEKKDEWTLDLDDLEPLKVDEPAVEEPSAPKPAANKKPKRSSGGSR